MDKKTPVCTQPAPGEKTSGGVGPGDSPRGWILGTQQTPGENIPGGGA
jgi:hypothetical protein